MIKLQLGVSENGRSDKVSLSDLGLSVEQWANMTDEQKIESLQSYVNDLPEQPYWVVDSYSE